MKVTIHARWLVLASAAVLALAIPLGASVAQAADVDDGRVASTEEAVTAADLASESTETTERQAISSGQVFDAPFQSGTTEPDAQPVASRDATIAERSGGRVCVDPRRTYVGSDNTRAYFRQYETCLRVSGDRFYVESTVLYRGTHGRNKPPKFDEFKVYAIVVGSSGYSVAQATCNSKPRASDATLHYDISNVWWTWDHHPLRCSGYIGDGKARNGRQYQLHSFIKYDIDGDGRGAKFTSRQRSAFVTA